MTWRLRGARDHQSATDQSEHANKAETNARGMQAGGVRDAGRVKLVELEGNMGR